MKQAFFHKLKWKVIVLDVWYRCGRTSCVVCRCEFGSLMWDVLIWISQKCVVLCCGDTANLLTYCVLFKTACYGIVQVPTGPWFCRKCESQERAARVVGALLHVAIYSDGMGSVCWGISVTVENSSVFCHNSIYSGRLFCEAISNCSFLFLQTAVGVVIFFLSVVGVLYIFVCLILLWLLF